MPAFAAAKRLVRRALVSAALFSLAGLAGAQTATYNPTTRQLTLPSVTVQGDTTYGNVVIRLDNFAVLSVGAAPSPITATCAPGTLTLAKFNAIAENMTLDQVKQLLGCQNTTALSQFTTIYAQFTWSSTDNIGLISVRFDPSGALVKSIGGVFKVAVGL